MKLIPIIHNPCSNFAATTLRTIQQLAAEQLVFLLHLHAKVGCGQRARLLHVLCPKTPPGFYMEDNSIQTNKREYFHVLS